MIKNIVFDVGRVLVAWDPEGAMRELNFSEETIAALKHVFFETRYWNETDRGVLSDEEVLALFISAAPEQEAAIREYWANLDLTIRQYPYAKDWIRECREAGYGVYILSNYGKYNYEVTKDQLDFVSLVDGAIFSYEVQLIKPDVEIFRVLCRRYDLVPEECVFIDDMDANVKAAEAAGMSGILFTGLEDAKSRIRALKESEEK